MSKQHTPTPKYKIHHSGGDIQIWGESGDSLICVTNSPDKAEFIVKACNNHYRLVEALEKALAAQDPASIRKSREEGIQLLTELKQQ